jgi:hypothetical protein
MDHTCATSLGQFLVPISDTACSFEPAIAIAVFSLWCFMSASRVVACDSMLRQPGCTQARTLDPWLVIVQRQGYPLLAWLLHDRYLLETFPCLGLETHVAGCMVYVSGLLELMIGACISIEVIKIVCWRYVMNVTEKKEVPGRLMIVLSASNLLSYVSAKGSNVYTSLKPRETLELVPNGYCEFLYVLLAQVNADIRKEVYACVHVHVQSKVHMWVTRHQPN